MSESEFEVSFPCFAGDTDELFMFYEGIPTVDVLGKLCVPLFTARDKVFDFWEECEMGDVVKIKEFNHIGELTDFLLLNWNVYSCEGIFFFAMEPFIVPEVITQLLYQTERDRFLRSVQHRPHYDWKKIRVQEREFLPLPPETQDNTGAFVVRSDGTMRILEGREIRPGPDGRLCLFDDDGRICGGIYRGLTVVTWGGELWFGSMHPPLNFLFTANDGSRLAYMYNTAKRTWYEQMISDGSAFSEDEARPGLRRCPDCLTWNPLEEFECMICKTLLVIPRCKRCGAEISNEADPCPVCDGGHPGQ